VLLGAKGRDAVADVESTLAEAANLIEEIGTKGLAPRLLERRAELARLNSDESEHQRLLREAQRLYSEIGAVGHADRLAARRDALRG
jgi:hypothetical protein